MGDITNVNQLKVNPVLTAGYVVKADGVGLPTDSVVYESSSKIGISNTAPDAKLDIKVPLDNSTAALKITQTDSGVVGTIESGSSSSGKYGGLKITGKADDYDQNESLHTPLTLKGEFNSASTYTPAVIIDGKVSGGAIANDEQIAGFYNNGTPVGPYIYGNGDFATYGGINIADSCGIIGWSSYNQKAIIVKVVGKTCHIMIYISGESNLDGVAFVLPTAYSYDTSKYGVVWGVPGVVTSAAGYSGGIVTMAGNTLSLGVSPLPSSSGLKRFATNYWYEIA